MDLAIDVQGFTTGEGFEPKEIAVVSVGDGDNVLIGHWILTPSGPFEDLPLRSRVTNNWLTKHHHGLEWYDGSKKCFRQSANSD